MYSLVLGCSVLYISMRSNSSSVAFKTLVSLSIFCMGVLSISYSGVLRSPTISVFLFICLFILVKSWLVYLAAMSIGVHISLQIGVIYPEVELQDHNFILNFLRKGQVFFYVLSFYLNSS